MERLRRLFDIDEILNLQPFGFRVVSFDRDLWVAVAEESGHLVHRRAGVGQLRRDGMAPGDRALAEERLPDGLDVAQLKSSGVARDKPADASQPDHRRALMPGGRIVGLPRSDLRPRLHLPRKHT